MLNYSIVETENLDIPNRTRRAHRVMLEDVDHLPDQYELKVLADRVYQSIPMDPELPMGDDLPDETTIWIYLPGCDPGGAAYGIVKYERSLEIQEAGLIGSEFL
jgi:hypothetical protein